MTPRIRVLLDDIDSLLAERTDESAQLWAILAAMRGPDYDSQRTKEATTWAIRGAAFPRAQGIFEDLPYHPQLRVHFLPSHFVDHAREAFGALDLVWDKQNDKLAKEQAKEEG